MTTLKPARRNSLRPEEQSNGIMGPEKQSILRIIMLYPISKPSRLLPRPHRLPVHQPSLILRSLKEIDCAIPEFKEAFACARQPSSPLNPTSSAPGLLLHLLTIRLDYEGLPRELVKVVIQHGQGAGEVEVMIGNNFLRDEARRRWKVKMMTAQSSPKLVEPADSAPGAAVGIEKPLPEDEESKSSPEEIKDARTGKSLSSSSKQIDIAPKPIETMLLKHHSPKTSSLNMSSLQQATHNLALFDAQTKKLVALTAAAPEARLVATINTRTGLFLRDHMSLICSSGLLGTHFSPHPPPP
ncbi:hypothetical protein PTTG_02240 [Puccinia triticina 1-1 BBBD Race 1]|uniref:Uncharacterized protein n=1 Tax=Puccinia triticina (isolate 1-1 / race 1 (BBBD)) TaxID=630390 RepID=A0A180G011_PUCT1|nr:hypothetical protein PTTG_02240 [Puccinia triticina 1-1 BBBD Race 1]